MKNKHQYLLPALLLLLIALHSCIMENLSGCWPSETEYLLGFKFSPEDNHDMEASDVMSLEVFAFDNSGIFVGRFYDENPRLDDPSYRISAVLPTDIYSFVVWGNTVSGNIYVTTPTNMIEGKHRMDEASLSLKRPPRSELTSVIDHLFYGQVTKVSPATTERKQEVIVPIVQNTYTLNIEIIGLDQDKPCLVTVLDNHSDYSFLNQRIISNELLYSIQSNIEDDLHRAQLRTLRLTHESDAIIRIHHADYDYPILSEPLLDLMRAAANNGRTVLDFDRIHTYNIRIEIDPVTGQISISINGWNVGDESYEIAPQ